MFGGGFKKGSIDSEYAVEASTFNLMRIYEMILNNVEFKLKTQAYIENNLSFLGIRFQKDNLKDFQEHLDQYIQKNKEIIVFKLSYRILCQTLEGLEPDLVSFEFFKIQMLKNKMLRFEHKVEPSKVVSDRIKELGRNNLIEEFKRYYWDIKAIYTKRQEDKQTLIDQSLLNLSYDASEPYDEIMSNKIIGDQNIKKFKDIENYDDEDYDDLDDDEMIG